MTRPKGVEGTRRSLTLRFFGSNLASWLPTLVVAAVRSVSIHHAPVKSDGVFENLRNNLQVSVAVQPTLTDRGDQ
jgi:hypothetical protein